MWLEHIGFESALIYRRLHHLLLLGTLYYTFLYGAFSNESVDVHIASLPNTMRSVSSLRVHRGIPVIIIENYSIGSR